MQQPPVPSDAEDVTCPICEQSTLRLLPGERAKCPTCGGWLTYGDPDESNR